MTVGVSSTDGDASISTNAETFKVCWYAVELHGGNGIMLDFGIEKLLRDASLFLHRDAAVDISRFKIVKAMFPDTAGVSAGPRIEAINVAGAQAALHRRQCRSNAAHA